MTTYKVRNETGKEFEVGEDKIHLAEKDGFLPVVSNGDQEHRVSFADIKRAAKDGFEPLVSGGEGDAGLRGAAQGFTAGLADEAYGVVGAIFNPTDSDKDFMDRYRDSRDYARGKDKQAEVNHNGIYTGANVAGGVASSMVPGLGVLNAVKGAKLAAVVGKGALQGAITGLGNSKADLTEGEVADAALDTVIGGVAGGATAGVIHGAGKGVRKIVDAVKGTSPAAKAAAVAANIITDVPEEHAAKILRDPDLYRKPIPLQSIADDTASTVGRLQQTVSEVDAIAWDRLSNKPIIEGDNVSALAEAIQKPLAELGIIRNDASGKEIVSALSKDRKAISKVQDVVEYIRAHTSMSEQDLKTAIQKIDREIDWTNPEMDVANTALKGVRHQLDTFLKEINPQYGEAMDSVATATRLLEDAKKEFRLKIDGDSVQWTDTTLSKLKGLKDSLGKNGRKEKAKDLLENLSSYRKIDRLDPGSHVSGVPSEINPAGVKKMQSLVEDLDTLRLYEQTKGGITNGSKGVMSGLGIGSILGIATGNPIPPALGIAAGMVRDKYGRDIGSAALRKSAGAIKGADVVFQKIMGGWDKMSPEMQKVLNDAAQRGAMPLVVTYTLMEKNGLLSPASRDPSGE